METLKRIALLESLSDEELIHFIERMQVRQFKKNETCIHQEEYNNYMYMILEGKVKVALTNIDGKEITLAIRHQGEFFGEMSLIEGKKTSATVFALENSTVAMLHQDDFMYLLYTQKVFLDNLLKNLSLRIRESNDIIERLTYNKAPQRIFLLFQKYASTHGLKTDEGLILNVKLTHQDIADMTSLLRETVTNTLNQWRKDGTLSILQDKRYRLNHGFLGMEVHL
jgi:CRP/FNR family transcriptional regulator